MRELCDVVDCSTPARDSLVYLNPNIVRPGGAFYRFCLVHAMPHIDPWEAS